MIRGAFVVCVQKDQFHVGICSYLNEQQRKLTLREYTLFCLFVRGSVKMLTQTYLAYKPLVIWQYSARKQKRLRRIQQSMRFLYKDSIFYTILVL